MTLAPLVHGVWKLHVVHLACNAHGRRLLTCTRSCSLQSSRRLPVQQHVICITDCLCQLPLLLQGRRNTCTPVHNVSNDIAHLLLLHTLQFGTGWHDWLQHDHHINCYIDWLQHDHHTCHGVVYAHAGMISDTPQNGLGGGGGCAAAAAAFGMTTILVAAARVRAAPIPSCRRLQMVLLLFAVVTAGDEAV